ncbi:MAG: exodeoxyribonuclease IX [Gammaproteobacteria bacterium]|nr:exodeoxyribonuclease IX [Gammaproteobacteria bacterium]
MIYLIDASVYVFRAYYAIPPGMTDREGQAVHAVFGFGRFLGDLIERARPEYVAVAFDESLRASFRNRLYPAYKANREPAPADLRAQFARCRELCGHLGLAVFGHAEYEADDIIGTLAACMRRAGMPATVVTRDKDLAQLVREGDVFWDYGADERYRYHEIEERFGVVPERMPDYLALTGDSVDNIPGVPGIGPRTAAALLREYASLEEIFDHLDELSGLPVRGAARLAERLVTHRREAFLARSLTEIHCRMPLEASPGMLRRRGPDLPALEEFFDRHGFGPMLRRQAARLAALPC